MIDNIPTGCLPFDLDKALAGHPVRRRDGVIVGEIILLKTVNTDQPIIAVSNCYPAWYTRQGRYWTNKEDSDHDIFLVKPEPKKVKVWIPVSKTKESHGEFAYYDTTIAYLYKDDAQNFIKNNWKEWQIIEAEIEVAE